MTAPKFDRRKLADRRSPSERRSDAEQRVEDQEERRLSERRSRDERRLDRQSAAAQMEAALALLVQVAESDTLGDEHLRLLDSAVLRLRFALEQMERD
ncbi:MAG TPA: hypothetical protein VEK86_04600 [Gemmatimonadales bacterium]|nr:hypothetical protein [Gemmatimonadales bacterium]